MSPRPGLQGRFQLSTAAERAREEETALLRRYKAWQRQRLEDLLAGPHGNDVQVLRKMLHRLGPDAKEPLSGRALVEHVAGLSWLRTADSDTRYQVLGIIDRALTWAREKRGLDLSDPLWDQPPNAYMLVRDLLRVRVEPTTSKIVERAHAEA